MTRDWANWTFTVVTIIGMLIAGGIAYGGLLESVKDHERRITTLEKVGDDVRAIRQWMEMHQ